jgi:hypothetical protein
MSNEGLNISKERKLEINNILKESQRRYENGEIKAIPLKEFLKRQRVRMERIMNECNEGR